jgi:3'-phosphoadenosine 5'-phosphosulfate sulfotransferase (PAPS reductase)/FAD synthetase
MEQRELIEKQAWSLDQKVFHSMEVIDTFIHKMGGVENVYVSFSGGKDSTVLLDICRRMYPNILAVYCQTGNEFPDIARFVRETKSRGANVLTIKPDISPREVWSKYGFPLVSKDQAKKIRTIRNNPNSKTAIKNLREGVKFKLAYKWRYLLDEDYDTSDYCCDKLKKEPFHRFTKQTGRFPIIGVMADESRIRLTEYLINGNCNYFDTVIPKSHPLSIWTDKDIWEYIKRYDLKVADIYFKGGGNKNWLCVLWLRSTELGR